MSSYGTRIKERVKDRKSSIYGELHERRIERRKEMKMKEGRIVYWSWMACKYWQWFNSGLDLA
jgi:hypothetical protein